MYSISCFFNDVKKCKVTSCQLDLHDNINNFIIFNTQTYIFRLSTESQYKAISADYNNHLY